MRFNLTLLASTLLIALPVLAEPTATPAAKPTAETAHAAQGMVRVDPATPVARVNGAVLTALQLSMVRGEMNSRGRGSASDDEYVRDTLVNAEIMAQEALKLGLDKDATLQVAIEMARKELLGRALVEKFASEHPVTDERIKAEYERLKAKSGDTEYRARHILVNDEKLAKDLIAKLKAKKAKFEDLAKQHSKDSSSVRGGDLGWMSPGNLVPEFSAAMVKMKKGDLSAAPVKTQFGWHVLKLEDSRAVDFPALDKVKARLVSQLMQNDVRQYVSDLRGAAKVEVPSPAPAAASGVAPAK